MTRAQYIALCVIGGISLVAFFQSLQVASALKKAGMMQDDDKQMRT